jgi:MoxR-like ATPase
MRAAQALATLRGREYILPDDIKCLAGPVLAHRLILKEEERLQGESADRIIEELIGRIPVPAAAG